MLDLLLKLFFNQAQMQGIYIDGLVQLNIGVVPGPGSQEVNVKILPLFGGLYEIGGLTLLDLNTGIEYDVKRICQVRISNLLSN